VDRFFQYMFTASRDHTLQFLNFRYSPLLERIRKDPRYEQIVSFANQQVRPTS